MPIIVQFLIGIALNIAGYLLMPKQKAAQPPSTEDLENPVSEAGMPVPVVFGTLTVKGLNILWWGDKLSRQRSIKSGKK